MCQCLLVGYFSTVVLVTYNVCFFLYGGRKPTQTWGEHAELHTERPGPDRGSNSAVPTCCEAAVLTTEPPCVLCVYLVEFDGNMSDKQYYSFQPI